MKIDEKTILIVIIVAILGFFLWKSRADRNAAAKAAAGGDIPPTGPEPESRTSVDTHNYDSIIAGLGCTPVVTSYLHKKANEIGQTKIQGERGKWQWGTLAGIADRQASWGITFSQACVCMAIQYAAEGEHLISLDEETAYISAVRAM